VLAHDFSKNLAQEFLLLVLVVLLYGLVSQRWSATSRTLDSSSSILDTLLIDASITKFYT
jgi:hypothetical protein